MQYSIDFCDIFLFMETRMHSRFVWQEYKTKALCIWSPMHLTPFAVIETADTALYLSLFWL